MIKPMGMISSVFHLTLGNTVQKISERLYLSYKKTNESPVAKFNIAADPEASKSGIKNRASKLRKKGMIRCDSKVDFR